MWTFRGKYLGAAKNFLLERKKKRFKLFSIPFSFAIVIIFTIMAIILSDGKIDDKIVIFETNQLHKHVKYAKKSGIYALILHNYPILVRSTGIEPAWSYPQDP